MEGLGGGGSVCVACLTLPLEEEDLQHWMLLEDSLRMKLHRWEQIPERITEKEGQRPDGTMPETHLLLISQLQEPTNPFCC